jgi:hypothetical protein
MPVGKQHLVTIGIAAAALLGFALRLFMLPHRELTFDEAATAYFAALPWSELWGAAGRQETNPPLFYALASIGARLGLSPEGLRLVSILPDAATAAVAGLLAWRLGGVRAGLVAAWLVACSATLIELSLEARAYSLLGLLGLLAILLALTALRDGRWRWFATLGLVEVLALYTHNVAAIMLGALNGFALILWLGGQIRPGQVPRWQATQVGVGLAWLYWLPTVLFQARETLGRFWIPIPSLLELRYAVQKVVGLPWIAWPQPWADAVFIALGAAGVVLLVRRRGLGRWAALGLVAVMGAVPAATWIISQWRPLMNGRVLLWLVPVFIVVVAVALGRLRWVGLALAALLGVAQLHAVPFWRPTASAERWPEVADLLRARTLYGARVQMLRILTLASVKMKADGEEGRHKVRLVITDVADAAGFANNLSPYVWECVLRWAYYLVHTKHFRLVFRPPRFLYGFPCFRANSDSSCINCAAGDGGAVGGVPDAQACATASMGGYSVYFEGSGVAIAECFSPRKLADSSAGSELVMATWAGKAVLALRMLQRELRLRPSGAAPLELDATAVHNGAVMETVTRKQRFNAARLGMLRQWGIDEALRLEKVDTDDMRSDILTKPVTPVKHFQRLAWLLLTGKPRGAAGLRVYVIGGNLSQSRLRSWGRGNDAV